MELKSKIFEQKNKIYYIGKVVDKEEDHVDDVEAVLLGGRLQLGQLLFDLADHNLKNFCVDDKKGCTRFCIKV